MTKKALAVEVRRLRRKCDSLETALKRMKASLSSGVSVGSCVDAPSDSTALKAKIIELQQALKEQQVSGRTAV